MDNIYHKNCYQKGFSRTMKRSNLNFQVFANFRSPSASSDLAATLFLGLCLALFSTLTFGCKSLQTIIGVQCEKLDWHEIGRADGAVGAPAEKIKEHSKSCQALLSEDQLALYENGYNVGLNQFCTSTRGFEAGKTNQAYYNVCPWSLEPKFLSGYNFGKKVHTLLQENRAVDQQVTSILSQIDPAQRVNREAETQTRIRELNSRKSSNNAEINRIEQNFTSTLL
jgi:hypothetical protein